MGSHWEAGTVRIRSERRITEEGTPPASLHVPHSHGLHHRGPLQYLSQPSLNHLPHRKLSLQSLERRELLAGMDAGTLPSNDGFVPAMVSADRLAVQVSSIDWQSTKQAPLGEAKIVGGHPTEIEPYPWMASLQTSSGHFCGGALVSPDVILTAAHCVEGVARNRVRVVLGRRDLSTREGELFAVDEIMSHPDYNPFSNDSDIALITLREPTDRAWLPILDLDNQDELASPGQVATILGWGVESEGAFVSPDELHDAEVPIVSNATANRENAYNGRITHTMLAAGYSQGGVDTCQGDSGGPLVVQDEAGIVHVAGIVSWGDGCARSNKFGIYSRVAVFADWIRDNGAVSSRGIVNFGQERYSAHDLATIGVRDADLIGAGVVDVTVSSSTGDKVHVTLTESRPGRFAGSVRFDTGSVQLDDDQLSVFDEARVSVRYVDQNDGTGTSVIVEDAVRIVADDHGNDPKGATRIDASTRVTGEIELAGDADWFSIEVSRGEAYRFEVKLSGSLDDSTISLYGKNGSVLLGQDDDGGDGLASRLIWQATSDERVNVVVQGYANHVGTYELTVGTAGRYDDDHGNAALFATPAQIETTLAGEIEQAGDADWFSLPVELGATYSFSTQLESIDDTTLSLVGTDGDTELRFNDDHGGERASRIVWTADVDGVVYLQVRGFDNQVGSYMLEFAQVGFPDDHGNVLANATKLQFPARFAAEIDYQDDLDLFQFEAIRGTSYRLQTELDTLGDSVLRLLDPVGNLVAQNDDYNFISFASRIDWVADRTSTMFVEVSGLLDRDVGSYQLIAEVTDVVDDHGNAESTATPILELPSLITGRDDFEGDQDWFRLEAVAGQAYRIDLTRQAAGDALLSIVNRTGQILESIMSEQGTAHVSWIAERSETLFVTLSDASAPGEYQLDVRVPYGDANLDGLFSSADLVQIFAAGGYEDDQPNNSQWTTGDWNGDQEFTTADLVLAFGRAQYVG